LNYPVASGKKGQEGRVTISSRVEGDVIVIELDGEFSREGCPRPTLHEVVKAALENGGRKIVVNLERAEYVSDFALGEILASYVSAKNSSGTLKLSGPSARWQEVLALTNFNKVIEIFPAVDAALKSFAKS
jgi:anti-sigma B factor antagonist